MTAATTPVRLNIGCGRTPTPGWLNFDNSPSVRLAHHPLLSALLSPFLGPQRKAFITESRKSNIRWVDVSRHIPVADSCVEVLYSSHMIQFLSQRMTQSFLAEARRVLMPGGILRLVVPDVGFFVKNYLEHHDADRLVRDFRLSREVRAGLEPLPRFLDRLLYLWEGDRFHQWAYDGNSLCRLLAEAGFREPTTLEAGKTLIKDPAPLNLREREEISVYVEAIR